MDGGLEQIFFKRRNGQKIHEKKCNITNHQGNVNQNHSETLFTLVKMVTLKQELTSVGEYVEKREPCSTAGENADKYRQEGKKMRFLNKL